MTSMKHTPGPWEQAFGKLFEEAHARRIVAAVNGCEGIPIEALEQGVVAELLAALVDLLGDLPSVQHGQCIRCGREYHDIEHGDCPSDDCPSFNARAAIAKAKGKSA